MCLRLCRLVFVQAHFDPTLYYQPGPTVPKHYWSPGEDQLLAAGQWWRSVLSALVMSSCGVAAKVLQPKHPQCCCALVTSQSLSPSYVQGAWCILSQAQSNRHLDCTLQASQGSALTGRPSLLCTCRPRIPTRYVHVSGVLGTPC
jgi:hypothetical protein